jgi:TPP-dependent pyruvate/acetoin dehydrogenase alpha subunit
MTAAGELTSADADAIEEAARADVAAAVAYAEHSPEPDLSTIEEGVYA